MFFIQFLVIFYQFPFDDCVFIFQLRWWIFFSLLLAIFTNYMKCIHEFLCKKTCLNSTWRVFYLIFVMKIFEVNSRCWHWMFCDYFEPIWGCFLPLFWGLICSGQEIWFWVSYWRIFWLKWSLDLRVKLGLFGFLFTQGRKPCNGEFWAFQEGN